MTLTPQVVFDLIRTRVEADPRVALFRLGEQWGSSSQAGDQYTLVLYELAGSKLKSKNRQHTIEHSIRLYAFDQRTTDWTLTPFNLTSGFNILSDLMISLQDDRSLEQERIKISEGRDVDFSYVTLDGKDRDLLTCVLCEFTVTAPHHICITDLPNAQ